MTTVLRIVVAGILLAAAISKVRDRDAVSRRLGTVPTVALIVVETTLAVWLGSGFTPRLAGAAAAALMLAFAGHLAIARVRGARALPCNCFGAGRDRPAWLLISRALGLAALAGIVVLAPATPSRDTLLVAAASCWASPSRPWPCWSWRCTARSACWRCGSRLGTRSSWPRRGPELGVEAPQLDGLERSGEELVAFLGAGCRVCHDLEPSLRALAREGLPVRLVYDVEDDEAIERWGVPGTPFVVALGDGIAVAKGTVNTLEEIEGLLALGRARWRMRRPDPADLAARLAAAGTRRSFLARVGAVGLAAVGGRMVAAAVAPEEAQSFHFCGHTFTTGSCPHPGKHPRIDRRGRPLRTNDGKPIDNLGRLVNGNGYPIDPAGKRLRGPDGQLLARAPRTRICEDWVPEKVRLRRAPAGLVVPVLRRPDPQADGLLREPRRSASTAMPRCTGTATRGARLLRHVLRHRAAVLTIVALCTAGLVAGVSGAWSP